MTSSKRPGPCSTSTALRSHMTTTRLEVQVVLSQRVQDGQFHMESIGTYRTRYLKKWCERERDLGKRNQRRRERRMERRRRMLRQSHQTTRLRRRRNLLLVGMQVWAGRSCSCTTTSFREKLPMRSRKVMRAVPMKGLRSACSGTAEIMYSRWFV